MLALVFVVHVSRAAVVAIDVSTIVREAGADISTSTTLVERLPDGRVQGLAFAQDLRFQ